MNDDLLLQTLESSPIDIYSIDEPEKCICKVYNLTIREIVKMKYSRYNFMLNNLVASPEDFGIKNDDKTTFDIIIDNMKYGDDEYRIMILDALELFLHENISYLPDFNIFYVGDISENRIINADVLSEIVDVLKVQNCVRGKEDDEFKNCANSRAEEIAKKILKGRESISKQNKSPNFKDLVSVLAANGNNLNILNIWDLTIYAFNDQFSRMQMIEEYDLNFRSLLAGCKSEDVDLKHYIRPIKN